MKTTRRYSMASRAATARGTRLRVLDAMVELAADRVISEISLDDIAGRAQVSVQTVLRHFGSRAGLIDAGRAHAMAVITDERAAPVGDVDAAIRTIIEHYEKRGDAVLLMLAQEGTDSQLATLVDDGRRLHRSWVETVFAPWLTIQDGPTGSIGPAGPTGPDEQALVDLLCVATDVYTWKLLRRDLDHDIARTQQRMHRLVRALLAGT